MLERAWATVPHSTLSTRSRGPPRQASITRAQSITPSPQAQPTGVPRHLAALGIGLPDRMSLAWRWTRRSRRARARRRVLAGQVAVARVEVHADGRRIDQGQDAVQAGPASCCTAGAAPGR